jgi:nucleoside-diphosphate-sugar epimerase
MALFDLSGKRVFVAGHRGVVGSAIVRRLEQESCTVLRASWAKAFTKAQLTELHFNDLRGTAVVNLAEAGCTAPEIASITGHSLKSVSSILEKYWTRTRTQAVAKLEAFRAKSGT